MSAYKKAKVGYEDFFWDTAGSNQTFSRENSEGNSINIKGLNASHIPLLLATRTLSLYDTDVLSADDIDEALTEIAASIAGIHKFSNQAVLDLITSAGSGAIMTVSERAKLNSIIDAGSGSIITAAERSKLTTLGALTDEQISIINNIDTLGSPVGSIIAWPDSSVPNHYLECDGREISRSDYSDLFGIIGTKYGVGDGSTTFEIPDFRGRFLRGWDHGAGTDPDASSRTDRGDTTTGDEIGTKQADQNKSHYHTVTVYSSGASASVPSGGSATPQGTDDTSTEGGNEARPVNTNVMWCIRYRVTA